MKLVSRALARVPAVGLAASLLVVAPSGLLQPTGWATPDQSSTASPVLADVDTSAPAVGDAQVLDSVVSTDPARPSWELRGAGFGHGVGMSQYGAKAMAEAGWSASRILANYYTGSAYSKVTDTAVVRVNVRHQDAAVTLTSSRLSTGGGTFRVTAGSTTLSAGLGDTVTMVPSSGNVKVTCTGCTGGTSFTASQPVVTFDDNRTLLSVDGKRYASGKLYTRAVSGKLESALDVRIHDEYLDNIREVPWAWPGAALQAQAAAARSYVLRRHAAGLRSECNCHVYDSVSSQVMGTYPSAIEQPYWPRWKAAVRAAGSSTLGYAPTYNGALLDALYSSSNGGWTEKASEVWGGADVPYLTTHADPWSMTSGNPNRSWSTTPTGGTLATAFGLPDVARLDLRNRTAANAVRTAVATASNGSRTELTGLSLRARLGLRSAWLRHGSARVDGTSPSAVAAAIARSQPSAAYAVVASHDTSRIPELLVAGPLASSMQAPLLTTTATSLPSSTATELDRRRASGLTTVYVVGNTSAVPTSVASAIAARGLKVIRVTSTDRYALSAKVARMVDARRPVSQVFATTAGGAADAVGAAPASRGRNLPVVFVSRTRLPWTVRSAVQDIGATRARVLGSTDVVGNEVLDQFQAAGLSTTRTSGDRVTISAAMARGFRFSLGGGREMTLGSSASAHVAYAVVAGGLSWPLVLTGAAELPEVSAHALQTTHTLRTVRAAGPSSVVTGTALRLAAQS